MIRFTRPMLVAVALAASAPSAFAQTGQPVVVTQGEAIVKRAPDRAWISVATETRDPKAADARRKSAEVMTAVQKALKDAGVVADAIRTTSYSLLPENEWVGGKAVFRGYAVRNQIEVRIDDLDKVGDVLDAANSAKGSTISITGPRFDLKNREAAVNDALRQAVESAMTRAQSIAAGARRSLGPIVRIEEQGTGPTYQPPMPMARSAMVADKGVETPVTPGEIEIRAQVSLTVEIR